MCILGLLKFIELAILHVSNQFCVFPTEIVCTYCSHHPLENLLLYTVDIPDRHLRGYRGLCGGGFPSFDPIDLK